MVPRRGALVVLFLVAALVLVGCPEQSATPTEPVAAFRFSPTEPVTGDPVSYDASDSTDPDGTVSSYEWDFDGDGTTDATTGEATVEHTYLLSGPKTIVLTVTDDDGLSDTTTASTEATGNDYPIAELTHSPSNPSTTDKVVLDASGSSDRDGSITSFKWDGDGDGTFESPWVLDSDREVGFDSPGTYEPAVKVTDDDGAVTTATTTVNVQ